MALVTWACLSVLVALCLDVVAASQATEEVSRCLEADSVHSDQCLSFLQLKGAETPVNKVERDVVQKPDEKSLALLQRLDEEEGEEEDEEGHEEEKGEAPGPIELGDLCRYGTVNNPGRKLRHLRRNRKCRAGRCLWVQGAGQFQCRCVQEVPTATCRRDKNCCPLEPEYVGSYCTEERTCQRPEEVDEVEDVQDTYRRGRKEGLDNVFGEMFGDRRARRQDINDD